MVPIPCVVSKAVTRTLPVTVPIQKHEFSHYHYSLDQKKKASTWGQRLSPEYSVELGKEDGNIPVTSRLYHLLLFSCIVLRASSLFLPSPHIPSEPQFLLRGTEDSGGTVTFNLFIVFPGCVRGGSPLPLPWLPNIQTLSPLLFFTVCIFPKAGK